ncbi:MAG: phosphotransferase [Pseudonocardiaceae bacterium]
MIRPVGQPESQRWIKRYRTATACQTTAANHRWLASLAVPVPAMRATRADRLEFDHVPGRHARPRDLPMLADLLGNLHRTAYVTDLHRARLDRPHTTDTGLVIPDFLTPRHNALRALVNGGAVPEPAFTPDQAVAVLESAVSGPACIYKDSNPRNFLITPGGVVVIDFDVLTLAPAGYDLAKLVVTLVMTHGRLPETEIGQALTIYNAAFTHDSAAMESRELEPVTRAELMAWAEIHHIFTSPYLGRNGYRYSWRPSPL